MREIKFRAKSGTQWRYGDLYHNERGELMIYEPLTKGKTLDGAAVLGWRLVVDPETVGQYTGLKDSDGREIYEGDIIKVRTQNPYWRFRRNFVVTWGTDGWLLDWDSLYSWFSLHTLEVIGNVHDSPEILEDSNGRF